LEKDERDDAEQTIEIETSNGKRYLSVKIKGKHHLVHRVCWLLFYGDKPVKCIDHINGNGLDNKIKNLREVTRSENQRNMRINPKSKSGVMGVCWDKRSKKWHVRYTAKGDKNKMSHGGYFSDLFSAVCARKSLEIKHGYHKNHGQNRPL